MFHPLTARPGDWSGQFSFSIVNDPFGYLTKEFVRIDSRLDWYGFLSRCRLFDTYER